MKILTYILLIGFLALSVGSGNVFAQATASATIQGTVTDKSGAVVSAAQVVAKNKATDLARTTTTSETGYYRFELLPVGTYTVTVTKSGFGTVAETIETLIGQVATINAELKPGATSEVDLRSATDVPRERLFPAVDMTPCVAMTSSRRTSVLPRISAWERARIFS